MSDGLLLLNGAIYTMDTAMPRAQAVAVSEGRFAAVGSDDELGGLADSGGWRVVDLRGRAVVPGFTDCHLHLLSYAMKASEITLEEGNTLEETLAAVKEFAGKTAPGAWIQGWGWSDSAWSGDDVPSRQLLDVVAPQHPVVLSKKDGHVIWVNSEALRRAGVDEDTPEPSGGVIERDSKTGQPTGILKEEAMHLVCNAIPSPGAKERQTGLRSAVADAQELGITGIHDCGSWQSDNDRSLSDYQEMIGSDDLGVRVFMMLSRANLDEALQLGLRTGFGNDCLRLGNLKLFADGTLGSRTAEMLEPFAGE